MSTPRNAPCPCGSGKKHKHCCGLKGAQTVLTATDLQRHAAHRLDDRLMADMERFAARRFGSDWMMRWLDYAPLPRLPYDEDAALVLHWAIFVMPVDAHPVAWWYMESRRDRLREDERRFLDAQLRSWPSLWEAAEVQPGAGVFLRDMLTGEEVFLNDHDVSRSIERWHVILGRIVRLGDIAIAGGLHPRSLPPREAAEVVVEARRLLRVRARHVRPARLQSPEIAAGQLMLFDAAVERLQAAPAVPEMRNTDGEKLLLTTDRYRFPAARRADVLRTIAGLEGAHASEEESDDAMFVVSKPGNSKFAAFPTTAIATLFVGPEDVRVETNSLERADLMRERMEAAGDGLLAHEIRAHANPEVLLRDRLEDEPHVLADHENDDEDVPADVRARVVREFKEKHYAGWPDTPLPALGGRSPRDAVRGPTGRLRVEALLKSMEAREGRLPESERFDVETLRRELGLIEPEPSRSR